MNTKFRRINLFGGPGSGKSTIAPKIFSYFKERNHNIGLVLEYVKEWAYIVRVPESFDQLYITAKQLHKEDVLLRHDNVDLIVTDCPIALGIVYSPENIKNTIIDISNEFEKVFPSINIFINRPEGSYNPKGRFQSKSEAIEKDNMIITLLEESSIDYVRFNYNDFVSITRYIELRMDMK